MQEKCYLVLRGGIVFPGYQFGSLAPRADELDKFSIIKKGAGEVVFNTGMSGYHEILTDPSYTGQIVLMTYPHGGNYGTSSMWNETGPEAGKKLSKIKLAGLVLKNLYRGPVPQSRLSLDQFMKENSAPGIEGVDTRKLTLFIRDNGSPKGVIVRASMSGAETLSQKDLSLIENFIKTIPDMEGCNLVKEVGTGEFLVINPSGRINIALLDCGVKANIIRELEKRNCKISLFPENSTADEIFRIKFDGVLFSNGPGDPAALKIQVETVKNLIGKIPLFGICLGHQLISQALGAKTYKMKFGHHGLNNPVRDLKTGKVFVTSQNHGFAVDVSTLPKGAEERFINANDNTQEGIMCEKLGILSAQFHPEAAPGPVDSSWIFDDFIKIAKEFKK